MSDVLSFFGPEKSGKTTVGFSAIQAFPDGLEIHFDFDLGRERAIWRFPKPIQERIKSIRFPEVPTWSLGSGAITKSWAEFERWYETALSDPQVRVIFIDTATQMHRLNADEYLENYVKRNKPSRSQLSQIEYRVPNSRTRAKIMAARQAQKLLILSHYEQDIYIEQFVNHPDGSITKESVKSGVKTHGGFGEIPYLTDYHMQLLIRNEEGKITTVGKIATPNPREAYGVEIPDPTYGRLMQTIDAIRASVTNGNPTSVEVI